jgi:predicted dehydrogenase
VVPVAAAEPLRETARDFLAAIAGRRRPRADAAGARAVVAALQAATISLAEQSRRVTLQEVKGP